VSHKYIKKSNRISKYRVFEYEKFQAPRQKDGGQASSKAPNYNTQITNPPQADPNSNIDEFVKS
jgi:hypothetical protein